MQLANNLIAVLSQALCPRIDTDGMVAAYEFMYVTPGIQNLIRENKSFRIDSEIQTGKRVRHAVAGRQSLDAFPGRARSAPKRRSTRARIPGCMVDRMQRSGHHGGQAGRCAAGRGGRCAAATAGAGAAPSSGAAQSRARREAEQAGGRSPPTVQRMQAHDGEEMRNTLTRQIQRRTLTMSRTDTTTPDRPVAGEAVRVRRAQTPGGIPRTADAGPRPPRRDSRGAAGPSQSRPAPARRHAAARPPASTGGGRKSPAPAAMASSRRRRHAARSTSSRAGRSVAC